MRTVTPRALAYIAVQVSLTLSLIIYLIKT
jgi:hypothetical protein